MSNYEKLRRGFVQNLSQKQAFGKSKHEAVKAARAAAAPDERHVNSPYIHSVNTFNQYVSVADRFSKWLSENHPECHKVSYAHKAHLDTEYIQHLIDKGYSADTISRTRAALAKVYSCHSSDIHDSVPIRHKFEITRSRDYTQDTYAHDCRTYGDVVEFCRIVGPRRCELSHITPECFTKDGDHYLCHFDGKEQNTKGGRDRVAYILPEHSERLEKLLEGHRANTPLFPEVPANLDVHALRAIYAGDLYNHIARNISDIPKNERIPFYTEKKDARYPNYHRTSQPAVYTDRNTHQKYDRAALLEVSRSLGHNRTDVVERNYIRFCNGQS